MTRRTEKKPRPAARFLALVGGAALAIGLAIAPAVPADAETLRWARVGDALTLDPHGANEGPTSTMLHHIYETLVGRATDGSLEPRLATEWRIHPDDPTVWEFRIRDGVQFHDGSVLTAEDVVFSLDRARGTSSDFRGLHAAVAEVTSPEPMVVHVRMQGPAPLYVQNLTNTFVMSRAWAEANDAVEAANFGAGTESHTVRNAMGTGPYVLVSRDPEVRTVLRRFEDHWDAAPQVTEIVYTPISEASTRISALLSGEVDLVQDVPVQDIARLEATPGINVELGPENRSIFFAYDMGSESLRSADVPGNPFANPLVREAMWLAIDRDAIRQVVMRGQAMPSGVAMPPFVNGWTEELAAYGPPDVARASQLVIDAGYPNGFSVDLHCPNDRYINDEAICQAFVGMLARIGIRANLVSQSRTLHFPLIQNRETDFYLLGWGVPPFDSAYVFDFLIHSRDDTRGGWNGSHYANPEIDALIRGLATETDLAVRNAMIAEIWAQIQEDRVLLAVHDQTLAYAMREGISLAVHPENQPLMTDANFGD